MPLDCDLDFDDDFDPVMAAQWRAGVTALYCEELRKHAEAAGMLDSPIIQEKLKQARIDAEAARQYL